MATVTCTNDRSIGSRRWLVAAVIVVVLAAAVQYAVKAAENASAIIRWRALIQSVTRGENVYNEWTKDGSFPYPPVAGLVLWPLTLLPPLAAGLTWFALKVLLAALAIRWSIRLASGNGEPFPVWALATLLALAARPLLSDLGHGNINILVLFLVTAALLAFQIQRDWLTGVLISVAAAIKLTPALFVAYFAYKRQWRVVMWSFAGAVAFLLVVPGAVLGFERNCWLLRSWSGAMVEPYLRDGKVETIQTNQSLPGLWFRLATDSPGLELENGEALQVNWLALEHRTAQQSLQALLLALLIWIAWLCRGRLQDRLDMRWACEWSLVFIAMLLISERSWKHHFVVMTVPYAVIVARRWLGTGMPAERRWLDICLVTVFLLMASTSSELAGWLAAGDGHNYAQAFGMFTVSALIVLVAIAAILRIAARELWPRGEHVIPGRRPSNR